MDNPQTAAPNTAAPPTPNKDTVRDQDKVMLVLSYLGLLALVPLLTVNDSPSVKWHAKQGIALMLLWFGFAVATGILALIPFVGILFTLVGVLGHLGFIVLTVLAIVRALDGLRLRIPLAASLAEKF